MAEFGTIVFDKLIYDLCLDWKKDKRTKKGVGGKDLTSFLG